MSDSYKISFRALQQEGLKDVFASLNRALKALEIDFYLIGALARDTWFAQKGIRILGTKDIDFAVMVSDESKYEELKRFLIKEEGFTESSSNEYVLFNKQGQQIDLLPFGALEIEGKRMVDKEGFFHTNISGFKEVYEGATEEVKFEGKYNFKVSTLAGIIILKLIAYDDRPEMRSNDISDIAAIIRYYFDLENDLIYEDHIDLFTEDAHSTEYIAARVLGRQMKTILARNALLRERVISILQTNAQLPENSKIGLRLVNGNIQTIDEAILILKEIITGIEE